MSEVVKIIGIGMIALIIIIIVKQYRPEFAIYISIISGILILLISLQKMGEIVILIQNISQKAGINGKFLSILLKITGIAILTEFAVSVCKDSGESAIASKIEMGSKVIIISMSVPIISSLLELMINILP
jgi:stage III sporulation protein AD